MPWLELQLTLGAATAPRAEAALETSGALSITLMDADAGTPDEAAILEPGVGEAPLWRSLTLLALFEADADRPGLTQLLLDALPHLAPDRIAFREVGDQDWERAWMDRYEPMRFGNRLWIYPWNIEPVRDATRVVVRLDPGLAFGTGTHPTTAMCLEWLEGLDLAGKTVFDYGCGSGVLAIAALALGARRAVGIDNDPQALVASRDNAGRNDVADRLQLFAPDALADGERGDVLVANILAGPLDELAPRFAQRVRPGAPFAISGILAGQEPDLVARYHACGFTSPRVARREGWVRIDGRRDTA
ncbi:MAG TPA: 50S ribosomal protein L11 methyltransferase [Rhodanobacteraceae bacterium]|nr:50S ribosomal protein L11 methyltransferase [Rhodanobacteraceae bacterium]